MPILEVCSMNSLMLKLAVVAITIGGLMLLALELFGLNFGKAGLALLFVGLVFCGMAAFRFQKRHERQQLDLMRDSALW
jgi:membrane-bound ClpP family serine protease